MTGVLEEMKEIKKENFELKLKLFFLEERLGISVGGDSMKNLSDENVELKVIFDNVKRRYYFTLLPDSTAAM